MKKESITDINYTLNDYKSNSNRIPGYLLRLSFNYNGIGLTGEAIFSAKDYSLKLSEPYTQVMDSKHLLFMVPVIFGVTGQPLNIENLNSPEGDEHNIGSNSNAKVKIIDVRRRLISNMVFYYDNHKKISAINTAQAAFHNRLFKKLTAELQTNKSPSSIYNLAEDLINKEENLRSLKRKTRHTARNSPEGPQLWFKNHGQEFSKIAAEHHRNISCCKEQLSAALEEIFSRLIDETPEIYCGKDRRLQLIAEKTMSFTENQEKLIQAAVDFVRKQQETK